MLIVLQFLYERDRPIDYDATYSREEPAECCEAFDWHFTPFEKECRAFGRLQEVGCEHLAVKVYGYVSLTSTQIKEKFRSKKSRTRFHLQTRRNIQEPLMGIVKDWVEMTTYDNKHLRPLYDRLYQVFHVPRMIEDLNEMHKHGIVVRDVRSDQYVNGVLVDLSCSATAPHPYGPTIEGEPSEYQPRWTFASLAAWDLFAFQWGIIELWNRDAERLVALLGKPQGLPAFCPFRAYIIPYSSREDRSKAVRPFGPFVPMLNHFKRHVSVIEPARWDPQEYIANGFNDDPEEIKKRKIKGKVEQSFVEQSVGGV